MRDKYHITMNEYTHVTGDMNQPNGAVGRRRITVQYIRIHEWRTYIHTRNTISGGNYMHTYIHVSNTSDEISAGPTYIHTYTQYTHTMLGYDSIGPAEVSNRSCCLVI